MMLENHMVLDAPDAPWNAEVMRDWECGCGQDHSYDVKTKGYPKWHSEHKFVEECSGTCGRRCCHACAVTCRVCGCHYCPDCRKGFHLDLKLCEGCGAYYETFAGHIEAPEVEKLLRIDARRQLSCYSHGRTPLESEIDWLILSLKEAWETLASGGAEAK